MNPSSHVQRAIHESSSKSSSAVPRTPPPRRRQQPQEDHSDPWKAFSDNENEHYGSSEKKKNTANKNKNRKNKKKEEELDDDEDDGLVDSGFGIPHGGQDGYVRWDMHGPEQTYPQSFDKLDNTPPRLVIPSSPDAIRPDLDALLDDPAYLLRTLRISTDGSFVRVPISPSSPSSSSSSANPPSASTNNTTNLDTNLSDSIVFVEHSDALLDPHDNPVSLEERRKGRRKAKFMSCLCLPNIDMSELRKLAWSGVPAELRAMVWPLLLNYLNTNSQERPSSLKKKRQEYSDIVKEYFGDNNGDNNNESLDPVMWHQIKIDVHRTHPNLPLWQYPTTQRSLERILYIWAHKHPASGYVQGINDLATPFYEVFLSVYIDSEPEDFDVAHLPSHARDAIEADTYWCLSELLYGIQDNYTTAQPGIHRQVARMKELCYRIDSALAQHLENQNVEFMQFAFRWVNCLLMREMSVKSITRLWDTYLAEGADAFSEYHIYVCVSFLVKWSEKLRTMEFQEIIMFLQSISSTQSWSESQTELLLSEAYMWKSLFHNAPNHLK